jgi:hypothetical protein
MNSGTKKPYQRVTASAGFSYRARALPSALKCAEWEMACMQTVNAADGSKCLYVGWYRTVRDNETRSATLLTTMERAMARSEAKGPPVTAPRFT